MHDGDLDGELGWLMTIMSIEPLTTVESTSKECVLHRERLRPCVRASSVRVWVLCLCEHVGPLARLVGRPDLILWACTLITK